jgi:hypothetical protein
MKDLELKYNQAVSLDSRPEKGERKICDDFILLMNEVSPKKTDKECLYLITVNSMALEKSPYNFDIVMWQVKLFD